MPLEAKKFLKVDRDFVKLMAKAESTQIVLNCCANELLKNTLPVLYDELERCVSRRPVVQSHAVNSWPSDEVVGGFFFAEEAVRTASSDRAVAVEPSTSTPSTRSGWFLCRI